MHPAIVGGVSSAASALAQEPPTGITSPPVSLIEDFERAGDIDRTPAGPRRAVMPSAAFSRPGAASTLPIPVVIFG